MPEDTLKLTVRERGGLGRRQIEIPIPPGQVTDLKFALGYISKYHASGKTLEGKTFAIDGVEAGLGTMVPQGSTLIIAEPVIGSTLLQRAVAALKRFFA